MLTRGKLRVKGEVSRSFNTVYQAGSDIWVEGYGTGIGSGTPTIRILKDSATNPPTTVWQSEGVGNSDEGSISSLIKKGWYWKVTTSDMTGQKLSEFPLK